MRKKYLAIDIGASSGRHIVGWMEDGRLVTREVYRFLNGMKEQNGRLTWDVDALFENVKKGIRAAFEAVGTIESLSVDTWGVDYVLLQNDHALLPCYAYRDHRTEAVIDTVHAKVPFHTLYAHTGCQFQSYNTIYQLCSDLYCGRLDAATDFLMMPEYLMYKLTGVKKKEYTEATTTGLINAQTGEFDRELLAKLSLPERLFPKLSQPGETVGSLLPQVAAEVGGQCRVVLCATHDTASAVEGIPMETNDPYISSGTWSLFGVKTPKPLTDEKSENTNYSNEGGVGYNRYLKNIMGMWVVNSLRAELCPDMPFDEIVRQAEQSSFEELVNINHDAFFSPICMKESFDSMLSHHPKTNADYFRCAYRSLALSYKNALDELERNTGKRYDRLYIVGGGAKNRFLNRLTEKFTKKQVIALPIEATAIGNLTVQIRADSAQNAMPH